MKNRKYKLTGTSVTIFDHRLYRIKALKNFGNVKRGELGGYIESYKNLSQTGDAWIGDNAMVFGKARVLDNAIVDEHAMVQGCSVIQDNALVTDGAVVFGKSVIRDYARLYNDASAGDSIVCGHAVLSDNMEIEDAVIENRSDVLYIHGLGNGYAITIYRDENGIRVKWKDYQGNLDDCHEQICEVSNCAPPCIPADQYQKFVELAEVYFNCPVETAAKEGNIDERGTK